MSATVNIGRDQNPLAVFTRLFGLAAPAAQASPSPPPTAGRPGPDAGTVAQIAAQPVAGSRAVRRSLHHSSNPGLEGVVLVQPSEPAPAARHERRRLRSARALRASLREQPVPARRVPRAAACSADDRSADRHEHRRRAGLQHSARRRRSTATSASISRRSGRRRGRRPTTSSTIEFASQIVSLQRELHDWRAIFGFTQSPNGNFAFHFTIALKAEPDIKFDYNRATVRSGISPF